MLIRFADPDSSGGVELLATLPLAASTCPSYHDAARDRLVSAGPSDAGGKNCLSKTYKTLHKTNKAYIRCPKHTLFVLPHPGKK